MSGFLRMSDAYSLAFHAMAYMAAAPEGEPVAAAAMAKTFGVSEAHLSKVLQRLAKVGLVSSRRGPGGGFTLGRAAEDISLLELYEAVDGRLADESCLLGKARCVPGTCVMEGLMWSIHQQVREHLAATKLSQVKIELPVGSRPAVAAGRGRPSA